MAVQRVARVEGMILKDRTFFLPLDHSEPNGESIPVFGREVVAADKEDADLPWLVFLQGGPGFESPRPTGGGWLSVALERYRVLLLDQRGTGRSHRLDATSLARFSPREQADRLALFRADAIVRDCEMVRAELTGGRPWTVLGQSFGGFCALTYLSLAPEALRGVITTGGLPPLEAHVDEVYRRTFEACRRRNHDYYRRYPGDEALVRELVEHLASKDVRLPDGGRLSARRFQQLGLGFGSSGGFESVHYLLEDPFVQGANGRELSYPFLAGVERALAFSTNPLYCLLHEAIYCQEFASNWSAHRVRSELGGFESDSESGPILFTGEMVFPWMLEDFERLRPLREAAELLAEREDWPRLYDPEVLSRNEVPVASIVYHDDLYVDREYSLETAETIGARVWVTNEFEHDGLRVHGEEILPRLFEMLG